MRIARRTIYAIMMLLISYAAAADDITLTWIGSASDAKKGMTQGLEEANLQGKFLGYSIAMQDYQNQEQFERTSQSHAVLTDMRGKNLAKILRQNPEIPVFYIGTSGHGLSADQCAANLLQVLPPEANMMAATKAWRESNPGKTNGVATAWHPRFVKFAARDLNKRYKANFGVSMTSSAWAGWVAVKAIATAFSGRGVQAALMFAAPKQRANLGFDGQKGQNMAFREDGLLPQLVLIGDAGELLGEAPGTWPAADQQSNCTAN